MLVVMGLCFGSLLGTGTASAADTSVDIGTPLVIERDPEPGTRPRPAAPCGRRFSAQVKRQCGPKAFRV